MIIAARKYFEIELVAADRYAASNESSSSRIAIVESSMKCETFELVHRCRIAFTSQHALCERLAEAARRNTLRLVHEEDLWSQQIAAELKRHLETLESQRRYDCGWGIGGYTRPVRSEIERLGGLWLNRHKVWAMPDRPSWLHILSLLPGNF